MGGQQSGLSRERAVKQQSQQISQQYASCFKQSKENPSYLKNLLWQCPKFTQNLIKMFPNALQSYEHFYDVVTYLRKYDAPKNHHNIIKNNVSSTTLIDRFFMICLGIETFNEFTTRKLSKTEAKTIFQQYMKLFMENPKISDFDKILAFINISDSNQINAKDYSSNLREQFPHIQKYLTDYFKAKFRDCVKDALILKNFKSQILKEDGILLALKMSELSKKQIVQLYSTETSGLSFHVLEKKILGYTGYWLLLIQHIQKNSEGQKQYYRFGAFQNGPIRDISSHQGDLTGYLFAIDPKIRFMTTDKGDYEKNFFYINNIDEKISKIRKGLGFGGNKYKENFKLWIDEDLDKSTVFNGNDPTYGFGCLASSSTQKLNINVMEVWGLGSETDIQNQVQYWQQRQAEIMKRRKVNKKQLIDGNANLVFEKTFAHRDQVYGQIDRKQEQQ